MVFTSTWYLKPSTLPSLARSLQQLTIVITVIPNRIRRSEKRYATTCHNARNRTSLFNKCVMVYVCLCAFTMMIDMCHGCRAFFLNAGCFLLSPTSSELHQVGANVNPCHSGEVVFHRSQIYYQTLRRHHIDTPPFSP